ncbi:EamA family transporter [Marinobacterium aestuariivivens]|uniref:EamA family transporter n=1 Tax=Marinobacterium aestuariivivens TaxID=1698799 RepID=A0ABW2A9P6_9GAMM
MMPIVWSLLSAILFAGTFLLVKIGRRTASTLSTLWITLSINVVILCSWSLVWQQPSFGDWWSWRFFILAGLFAPLLGRLFQFIGMARLGANITTPITLTHPLVTVIIAVVVLDESVTLPKLAGGMLVLVGSLIVGAQGVLSRCAASTLVPGSGRYLLFPVGASLAYGISIVFRKTGIELGTDPITASAVTTLSSWALVTLYVLARRQASSIRCTKDEACYLGAAGVLSSLGPVFLYLALQQGI